MKNAAWLRVHGLTQSEVFKWKGIAFFINKKPFPLNLGCFFLVAPVIGFKGVERGKQRSKRTNAKAFTI